MRLGLMLIGLMAMASPSFAQTVGLLIGNESYEEMRNIRRGDMIVSTEEALERAGFDMISRRNANLEDLLWSLSEFGEKAREAETLIVGLSGRFVYSTTETYFLPVDQTPEPLATIASRALPMSTVMAWLGAHPENALLLLTTDGAREAHGPLLTDGLGEFDIPEGVTVLMGTQREVTQFLRRTLPRPGRPFIGAARQQGLEVLGYDENTHVLIEAPSPPPTTADDRRADILSWRSASSQNTIEAYQGYLEEHPNGAFAAMAENRIKAMIDTPEARAERAEQALDLSRDARRAIQRDLSLLGYNTRGIDGIFGRGTRAAITSWQEEQRYAATGYLSREEIEILSELAAARAAELEAEAERRRQEQLAADIAYWDQTGSDGTEEGLRQYLNRFPDGEFAEVAIQRLQQIEDGKRQNASLWDQRLWDLAVRADSIAGYESYLDQSPNGAFREDAIARLQELESEQENSQALRAAQRAEQSLNLSTRTRQLVEARLNGMGLKPGRVDGVFDDDTRRAIRRYQASRDMEETGYLSEAMVVQLMADTVRQIFR